MKSIPDIEQFKSRLNSKKMKATAQRLAVHRAMIQLVHASADDVFSWIEENQETKVTRTSVYNTLLDLAQCGIYKRRLSFAGKMFFDANVSKHIHLYDQVNHEFKDIVDYELSSVVEEHFREKYFKGYKLDDVVIQLVVHPARRRKKVVED